jgi:hypothetical protein
MTTVQPIRSPTGADLVGLEMERELKAMLMASLRAKEASLELELTNLASRLCEDIDGRLADIERRTGG